MCIYVSLFWLLTWLEKWLKRVTINFLTQSSRNNQEYAGHICDSRFRQPKSSVCPFYESRR